jgi:hypothetical protein
VTLKENVDLETGLVVDLPSTGETRVWVSICALSSVKQGMTCQKV